MADLFPELRHLKGGKKQAWINEHLDIITALADKVEFERLCELLHMKPDTLSRALAKAESSHRPIMTKADKAMGRAVLNEGKINDVINRLNRHAEALDTHFAEDGQLLKYMVEFHKLQAAANTIMAELMSSVAHTRDLTYHI